MKEDRKKKGVSESGECRWQGTLTGEFATTAKQSESFRRLLAYPSQNMAREATSSRNKRDQGSTRERYLEIRKDGEGSK